MTSGPNVFPSRRLAGPNRRHFLRGLGASIALPAFASLSPGTIRLVAGEGAAAPATTATGMPLRTAFVYFPTGAIPAHWWPAGAGPDFQFTRTLQPLESLR